LGLLVLAALVAASPAVAAKKNKRSAAEPTVFERNEAGYRLVRDSMPIYLPVWAMPMYMAANQPAAPKKSKRHH
jgi:hypothetical protein